MSERFSDSLRDFVRGIKAKARNNIKLDCTWDWLISCTSDWLVIRNMSEYF
jgi:hypothetical protein